MKTDETLTLLEVLPLVRVGERALATWVKRRRFPRPITPPGQKRLWSAAAVRRWLAGEYAGGGADDS